MKFSVVITIDKVDIHTKVQGQKSKVMVKTHATNWAFPDCNYSLNSPMATKTKPEVA